MTDKKQLSKIPESIHFQFYPQQQLHAFIEIQNLTEQILSYKIKTTSPESYLVKPMEGQIYKKQKTKVVFKRKKLAQETFQAIKSGIKISKERFQILITAKSKNAIGIEKIDEQTKYVNVKFVRPRKAQVDQFGAKKTFDQSALAETVDQPSVKKGTDQSPAKKAVDQSANIKKKDKESDPKRKQLRTQINLEKKKLQELNRQRQQHQVTLKELINAIQKGNSEKSLSLGLNLQHIICLLIICMLLGFLI